MQGKRSSEPNYVEGDCFAVPLRSGGYACGAVARANGEGIVFGYFFGPMIPLLEQAQIAQSLTPQYAILCGKFGDLGLMKGDWKIIGRLHSWSRKEWPIPPFLRCDRGATHGSVSYYDEDTLGFLREERVDLADANLQRLPKDSVMGYGFVELRLTKLFG